MIYKVVLCVCGCDDVIIGDGVKLQCRLSDYIKDCDVSTAIYIVNLEQYKRYIINCVLSAGYTYNTGYNLHSMEYSGYVDGSNNVYFLLLRKRNEFIKIIDVEKILNYKNIKNNCCELYNDILKIVKKYGVKNTAGKYAIDGFMNFLKNKYKNYVEKILYRLNKSQYNFCYCALFGGVNVLEKSKAKKIIKNVSVYDVNSMYPAMMMNKLLPYREPVYYTGEYKYDKNFELYVQHIKVDFNLKKDGVAFLNLNKNYYIDVVDNNLLSSGGRLIDLYLTNIDLKNFFENYTVNEIYYIDGLKFRATKKICKDYIKKIYREKEKEKNPAIKKFLKSLLNLIYGKMATKPTINKKGIKLEKNKVKFYLLDKIKTKTIYIPFAVFITAYARDLILEKIKKYKKNFIYCDTDSLHLINTKIKTSNKIGELKCEEKNARAIYLQNKLYLIKEKNKQTKKVICGACEEVKEKINFKNFKKGKKIEYKKIEYDENKNKIEKKLYFTI